MRHGVPCALDARRINAHRPQSRHQGPRVGQWLPRHRASGTRCRIGVMNDNQIALLYGQSPRLRLSPITWMWVRPVTWMWVRPQCKARTDDGNDASHKTTPEARMRAHPLVDETSQHASGPAASGDGLQGASGRERMAQQGLRQQSPHWLPAEMGGWPRRHLAGQGSAPRHRGRGGAVPAYRCVPSPAHWVQADAGEWPPDATALQQRLGLLAVGARPCGGVKPRANAPDLPALFQRL